MLQIQAVVKKHDILFIADEVTYYYICPYLFKFSYENKKKLWICFCHIFLLGNLCLWKAWDYVWI